MQEMHLSANMHNQNMQSILTSGIIGNNVLANQPSYYLESNLPNTHNAKRVDCCLGNINLTEKESTGIKKDSGDEKLWLHVNFLVTHLSSI